jgi:acetyl esterase/lipase
MTARLIAAAAVLAAAPSAPAQDLGYKRDKDVIYGRRDGLALTLDVFAPGKPNGAGVILCVSGEFKSGREMLDLAHPLATAEVLRRGYVVFAVTHGSQPRYSVPEIVEDVHRAVRFVRSAAKTYGADPARLGIAGASSGGHLALMMGCAGRPGDPAARDPVDREPSRVAAVACFFPVTDFLAFEADPPKGFEDLFPFREFDPKAGRAVAITADRRREIGRLCSPLHCATKDAAPALLIHGDKDDLVPLKQSEALADKLGRCGVACKLDVKKGMGHSALAAAPHLPQIADWFDAHLLGKK